MLISGIRPGDLLLCDVRGDRFYALAVSVGSGRGATVDVESLTGAARGDRLEKLGWPAVAADIREGVPPKVVAGRLRKMGEVEVGEWERLLALLDGWADAE